MSNILLVNDVNELLAGVEREIGIFVRAKRKATGLGQETLAERCGIVRRTLFSLEAGEGGNLRTLLSVLAELGVLEAATEGFRTAVEMNPNSKPEPRKRTAVDKETPSPAVENPWIMTDHSVL
jgi:transcriptional regulator with XRE-family HTH domain